MLIAERRTPQTVMHSLPLRRRGRHIDCDPIGVDIVSFVERAIKPGGIFGWGQRHLEHFRSSTARRLRML